MNNNLNMMCYYLTAIKTCIDHRGELIDEYNIHEPHNIRNTIKFNDNLTARTFYKHKIDTKRQMELNRFLIDFYRGKAFVSSFSYTKTHALHLDKNNILNDGYGSIARDSLTLEEKIELIEALKPNFIDLKQLTNQPNMLDFTIEELYAIHDKFKQMAPMLQRGNSRL